MIVSLHEVPHLGDLAGEGVGVEEPVHDISVKRVDRAKSVARIGSAQVFEHLPGNAHSGDDEPWVNRACQGHRALTIAVPDRSEPAQREQPHREVVEVLAVPVGGFPDADSHAPPKNAVNLSDHPFRFLQVPVVAEDTVEGDEQDHPEGICPQVAPSVGPDPPFAHPPEPLEDDGRVAADRRGAGHDRYNPKGYVSGMPVVCARPSGVTAAVRSNHTYSSNCRGRLAWK